jgi:hypothetical protein
VELSAAVREPLEVVLASGARIRVPVDFDSPERVSEPPGPRFRSLQKVSPRDPV